MASPTRPRGPFDPLRLGLGPAYDVRMESQPWLDAGDQLVARPFKRSDTSGVFEAVRESGADLSRFETWASAPFTTEKAAEYIGWWIDGWADGSAHFFALIEVDRLVGACGLFGLGDDGTASMGYWIRSSCAGRGLATRAALVVSGFGFEELRLSTIDLQVSEANPASVRVARRLGATRVGPAAGIEGGLPGDHVSSVYRLESPDTRRHQS